MANKLPATAELLRPKDKTAVPEGRSDQERAKTWPRLWFSVFLVLGLLVLIFVSSTAWSWLKNVRITTNLAPTQVPINTLNIQRSANYASLKFTLENAQYATTFMDDYIHPGAAIIRLNMHVANTSGDQVNIVYYDVAHLLAPKSSIFDATNVKLSLGPQPGAGESGWIDFSVPDGLQVNTLQLQLGSTLLGEALITIPFAGPFDGSRYNDRSVAQNLTINYYFPHDNPQLLIYQLMRVDIRYAYLGSQVKAGLQYYVLNFSVNNLNGNTVSPGFGYDYIRLIYNGGPPHPPVDNTLPYSFNALKTTSGRVVFEGPADLRSVAVDFLVQYGSGGSNYNISL